MTLDVPVLTIVAADREVKNGASPVPAWERARSDRDRHYRKQQMSNLSKRIMCHSTHAASSSVTGGGH
jgi:hypothetical protein